MGDAYNKGKKELGIHGTKKLSARRLQSLMYDPLMHFLDGILNAEVNHSLGKVFID
jgi:hypothetical protein